MLARRLPPRRGHLGNTIVPMRSVIVRFGTAAAAGLLVLGVTTATGVLDPPWRIGIALVASVSLLGVGLLLARSAPNPKEGKARTLSGINGGKVTVKNVAVAPELAGGDFLSDITAQTDVHIADIDATGKKPDAK